MPPPCSCAAGFSSSQRQQVGGDRTGGWGAEGSSQVQVCVIKITLVFLLSTVCRTPAATASTAWLPAAPTGSLLPSPQGPASRNWRRRSTWTGRRRQRGARHRARGAVAAGGAPEDAGGVAVLVLLRLPVPEGEAAPEGGGVEAPRGLAPLRGAAAFSPRLVRPRTRQRARGAVAAGGGREDAAGVGCPQQSQAPPSPGGEEGGEAGVGTLCRRAPPR